MALLFYLVLTGLLFHFSNGAWAQSEEGDAAVSAPAAAPAASAGAPSAAPAAAAAPEEAPAAAAGDQGNGAAALAPEEGNLNGEETLPAPKGNADAAVEGPPGGAADNGSSGAADNEAADEAGTTVAPSKNLTPNVAPTSSATPPAAASDEEEEPAGNPQSDTKFKPPVGMKVPDKEAEGPQDDAVSKDEDSPAAKDSKASEEEASAENDKSGDQGADSDEAKDDGPILEVRASKKDKGKKTAKKGPSTELEDKRKSITLNEVLEQGLRENPDEKSRQYKGLITDLQLEGLKSKFYYPTVQLVLRTENQKIGSLYSGDNRSSSSRPGDGAVGLQLGDYTVFNWGKDYLEFMNSKDLLVRTKQSYFERRRELKLDLVVLYFRMLLYGDLERIEKERVRHATFLYRLNREKAPLLKITQQEFYQTKSLYFSAQKAYNEARINAHSVEKELAYSIGDPISNLYYPEDALKFRRLFMSLEDALKISVKENPGIKEQKVQLVNANRNMEKVLKDNLPLPKLSVNLGSYLQTFSKSGAQTNYSTNEGGPGGRNLELRASINMTWDILGEKGLLNTHERATAHYEKMVAEVEYQKAKHLSESKIMDIYRSIKETEAQEEIAVAMTKVVQKKFDHVMENYLKKKATFLEIKDALDDLISGQENEERTKYQHLLYKMELAKTIGVEDFPGENFETLAVRRE